MLCVAAVPAQAGKTLNTIDLTALDGTNWSTIATTPVRLSFGSLGMGTVSVASVNGGSFINAQTPVLGLPYYQYTSVLGSGDTLNSLINGTSVFSIGSPTAGAPSGFTLTFTLDSGNFAAGTAFIIGSLDKNSSSTAFQAFSPGAGFGAMDTVSLASDGTNPMVATAPGGLGTLYENSATGVSDSRAFQLLDAQESFSIEMLQSPGGRGGISFALATAAVPEPATWAMMLVGFGAVGFGVRRRNNVRTAVQFV
jgi:hypothetical protein